MIRSMTERRRYMFGAPDGYFGFYHPCRADRRVLCSLLTAGKFFSDSYKEAFKITEEAKVGVSPGIDFGSGGEGFLGFSYATLSWKIFKKV